MPGRFFATKGAFSGKSWSWQLGRTLDEALLKIQQAFSILQKSPNTPQTLSLNVASAKGLGPAPALDDHIHKIDLGLAVKGDLLSHTGAIYARVPPGVPSAGYVLTWDPAEPTSIKWAAPSGGGGGGGLSVLDFVDGHDFDVPGTSVSFLGLDGDVDELYFVVFRLIKGVAAATNVDLRPNGVTTNQEMRGQYAGTLGTGVINAASFRLSQNGSLALGWADVGQAWIDAKTGTNRTGRVNYSQADPVAGIYELDAAIAWNEKVTNITSFDVVCDQANGIGAGSYVRLYKLRKVASAGGGSVTVGGVPSGLANANTEGVSVNAPRLDHQHKRDVRVREQGTDIATRNALDFGRGFSVTDDQTTDSVEVEMRPAVDLRHFRRRRLLASMANNKSALSGARKAFL